jgi:hypothetical protein
MSFFKRTFGLERSAAGKTLDRIVFGGIVIAVAIGFYAGWKALLIALAVGAAVIFGLPLALYLIGRTRSS